MEIKKSEVQIWGGTYKGVSFEINNWKTSENKDAWTYYLILHIDRIPSKHKPSSFWLKGIKNSSGRVFYKYYNHNILSSLDWHCGITWYSKERGFDGDKKVIKVGCDYMHYWDEGHYYDLDTVKYDVEKTIDSFLNYIPNYKYWCEGNGNLYSLNEGVVINGRFYSHDYYSNKDWFTELWEKQLLTNKSKN